MKYLKNTLVTIFFFILGSLTALVVTVTFAYLIFTATFKDRVYPGVKVTGITIGGKTKEEVEKVFPQINFDETKINFTSGVASSSALGKDIALVFDSNLMSDRALSIGRQTKNPYYNFLQIFAAWQGKIDLPLETNFDKQLLVKALHPIAEAVEKDPVDAIFEFVPNVGADHKGRVRAFVPSRDGLAIDYERLFEAVRLQSQVYPPDVIEWDFSIPTKVVPPIIKSSTADAMGIKDFLGRGESYFYDSIPTRIHNIGLATSKIQGSLVSPNEIFSFSNAIGTVSAVIGYQKAYAIIQGKTVLDDGGGVCQVSTTLYRAVLNSGLPVVARTPHSYRVGFYEEGGFAPGMDATVYPPSPDFKFKNDTGQWILIQTTFDTENHKLTVDFFGTNDGRKTKINGPFISNITPPPPPIYEDDPTLAVGITKQTDTAHAGANTYFTRTVVRGDKTLINETVVSNYIPWPARFLKGTKAN
jgi:vancomycin resistance protein YoaR